MARFEFGAALLGGNPRAFWPSRRSTGASAHVPCRHSLDAGAYWHVIATSERPSHSRAAFQGEHDVQNRCSSHAPERESARPHRGGASIREHASGGGGGQEMGGASTREASAVVGSKFTLQDCRILTPRANWGRRPCTLARRGGRCLVDAHTTSASASAQIWSELVRN